MVTIHAEQLSTLRSALERICTSNTCTGDMFSSAVHVQHSIVWTANGEHEDALQAIEETQTPMQPCL